MRIVLCFICAMSFYLTSAAQKVFFVFLQSDNSAPFYVKLGDRIYTSLHPGYLIISGLTDSSHQLTIGFPNTRNEARFLVSLKGKDRGYIIKQLNDGLSLIDLQSGNSIRPLTVTEKGISYRSKSDAFTYLLSQAANDTSLLYVAVVTEPEAIVQKTPVKKQEELQPVLVKSVPKNNDDNVKEIISNKEVIENKNAIDVPASVEKQSNQLPIDSGIRNQLPDVNIEQADANSNKAQMESTTFRRSVIRKHSESSTSEGFGLVFHDRYEGGIDTIKIQIPNPKIIFRKSGDDIEEKVGVIETEKDTVKKSSAIYTNKFPPCRNLASAADFLKIRKNMAARSSDDGMVDEARKHFKSKCFTAEQIRNLSALFLSSAGKYQFFEAAYRHVSDTENFKSLGTEIREEYYSNRFNTLVGN